MLGFTYYELKRIGMEPDNYTYKIRITQYAMLDNDLDLKKIIFQLYNKMKDDDRITKK